MNLSDLDFSHLKKIKRGIEREALRITNKGKVAQSKHPSNFGEKLTHPNITTDYSEGLLELITEPFNSKKALFQSLSDYLTFAAKNLENNELFWALSMPPITTEEEIKIAHYGQSNSARMKEVYRYGLAARYGKIMQIIAGIHYNFSFPDEFLTQLMPEDSLNPQTLQFYKNKLYFRLIRKFYQSSWLLPYLFGSTPLIAKTSLLSDKHRLKKLDADYLYGEHATSLRMSEFGYQSEAQKDLHISYRDLTSYIHDLVLATQQTFKDYTKLGVLKKDFGYNQLNDCILQIENEYYNPIRPKQIVHRCERPACALSKRGVSYIELRTIDIDPFSPEGISKETTDFLDVFFSFCLLAEAPMYSKASIKEAKDNFRTVVKQGRKPNLNLKKNNQSISLKDWGACILNECLDLACQFDKELKTKDYTKAVYAQIEKINQTEKTPSFILLDKISQSSLTASEFLFNQSIKNTESLKAQKLLKTTEAKLKREVLDSQKAFKLLEEKEEGSFESYIQRYYASVCR